ncbi:hypothetical protein EK21DRAFT_112035 [Setomelanomma holmii]|uniref:Uncharacterized protein n=1 Tax=Setomelanomma holmii TaxID=210430 RepID=A0A9P4H903_9PLEO|nr:hypothetical protein EK21DRAFT_112035 [Setomelanomma holmii]
MFMGMYGGEEADPNPTLIVPEPRHEVHRPSNASDDGSLWSTPQPPRGTVPQPVPGSHFDTPQFFDTTTTFAGYSSTQSTILDMSRKAATKETPPSHRSDESIQPKKSDPRQKDSTMTRAMRSERSDEHENVDVNMSEREKREIEQQEQRTDPMDMDTKHKTEDGKVIDVESSTEPVAAGVDWRQAKRSLLQAVAISATNPVPLIMTSETKTQFSSESHQTNDMDGAERSQDKDIADGILADSTNPSHTIPTLSELQFRTCAACNMNFQSDDTKCPICGGQDCPFSIANEEIMELNDTGSRRILSALEKRLQNFSPAKSFQNGVIKADILEQFLDNKQPGLNPGNEYDTTCSNNASYARHWLSQELNMQNYVVEDDDNNASALSSYAAPVASVFSIPSLASLATGLSKSSGYSAVQIATATKVLISIFLEDEVLRPLYQDAISNTAIGPKD